MKKGSFPMFLLWVTSISLMLYGALFMIFTRVWAMPKMPIELMIVILFAVTIISRSIIIRAEKSSPRAYTYSFIGTSTMRLILYSIFVLAFSFKHREIAKQFILTFFVLYIIYSAFDLKSASSYLKRK
jgi:hypothetical protein